MKELILIVWDTLLPAVSYNIIDSSVSYSLAFTERTTSWSEKDISALIESMTFCRGMDVYIFKSFYVIPDKRISIWESVCH